MRGEPVTVELLRREAGSLHARIREWPVRRFRAAAVLSDPGLPDPGLPDPGLPDPGRAAGRPRPTAVPRSRGDAVYDLVRALAGYAEEAAGPAPPGCRPPRLGDHALADQLAVLTDELLAAPAVARVAPQALAHVLSTRTSIDGSAPPEDARAAAAQPGEPG